MLGHLKMPIDDAITTYRKLMETTFSEQNRVSTRWPCFSHRAFEKALKDLLAAEKRDPEEQLLLIKNDEPVRPSCKT